MFSLLISQLYVEHTDMRFELRSDQKFLNLYKVNLEFYYYALILVS